MPRISTLHAADETHEAQLCAALRLRHLHHVARWQKEECRDRDDEIDDDDDVEQDVEDERTEDQHVVKVRRVVASATGVRLCGGERGPGRGRLEPHADNRGNVLDIFDRESPRCDRVAPPRLARAGGR